MRWNHYYFISENGLLYLTSTKLLRDFAKIFIMLWSFPIFPFIQPPSSVCYNPQICFQMLPFLEKTIRIICRIYTKGEKDKGTNLYHSFQPDILKPSLRLLLTFPGVIKA